MGLNKCCFELLFVFSKVSTAREEKMGLTILRQKVPLFAEKNDEIFYASRYPKTELPKIAWFSFGIWQAETEIIRFFHFTSVRYFFFAKSIYENRTETKILMMLLPKNIILVFLIIQVNSCHAFIGNIGQQIVDGIKNAFVGFFNFIANGIVSLM